MGLYEDLPPAQGEVTTASLDKVTIEASGHAKLGRTAISTQNPSVKSWANRSSTSVPSVATFKPRQTSKITATQKKVSVGTTTARQDPQNLTTLHVDLSRNCGSSDATSNNLGSSSITSYEINGVPYNPCKPNDYLEWCEERVEKKRAKRLEEENRIVLSAMEMSRKTLEAERLEAAKSGDIRRLEASALGGGQGGRGRGGKSNLPAWMTSQQEQRLPQQQQKEEKKDTHDVAFSSSSSSNSLNSTSIAVNEDTNEAANNRKRGLFTNPSCVLLLQNFGKQIDSNIEKEMAEECGKYGAIKKVGLSEEAGHVQVFICFAKQESAVRAFRDLNGRYFDGRQILASFFDEQLFWSR